MGLTQKRFVLGQVATAATTETLLYSTHQSTTFSVTEAIVKSIVVCNRDTSATTFRVAVVPDGKADLTTNATGNKHYVAYDVDIAENDTATLKLNLFLSDKDDVRVYAAGASVSFSAFGFEFDGNV